MEALDGVEIHDMAIAIGWGKSVPLPSVPCWPPPGGLAAAREGGAAVPPPVADAAGRRIGKFGGGRTGARKEEVRCGDGGRCGTALALRLDIVRAVCTVHALL